MPLSIPILFVCVIIIWLIYFAFFREEVRKFNAINAKSSKCYPILGTLKGMIDNHYRACHYWLEIALKCGHTWKGIIPGLGAEVYTMDPKNVEYILKTNFNNYPKAPIINDTLRDMLGNGIFNVNGPEWKFQRQMASHMFKKRLMRSMIDTFLSHGKTLIGHLEEYSKQKRAIDIKQLFYRFTLDSIGEIAFGNNIGALENLEHDVPFATAFDYTQAAMDRRFYNPLWPWLESKRIQKELAVMDTFTLNIIQQKRQAAIEKEKEETKELGSTDLLALFMEQTDEVGLPLSDRFLQDIIMNFMIAGRDTTGQTLCWLFYELSRHPEVEQKLIEEIKKIVGNKVPTLDLMKELIYCKAVIDETLRLWPPVPSDPKMALHDDILPDGTIIPAKTMVGWSAFVMGHHPDLWDEPENFDPERWLDERAQNIRPYQHIPFQAGPRICLGMNMAYLELRVVLSLILPRFHLQLVPDQDIGYAYAITLPPKGPIYMIPRKTN